MTMRSIVVGCLVAAAVFVAACSNPEADKRKAFDSGNQYFDQKKYAEAIVEYRNAIKADERFGEARYKLAEAYAYSGNPRAAYAEYIRAADLLPENAEVQNKAVTYLLLARKFEDAKSRVQKVLDRDPENVQALTLLGNALAGLKDLEGAIEEVEQAVALDPSRSVTYTNLAALRLAQGDSAKARAAFQKAVEVDPKSVPAHLALGNFQWVTGDAAAAEQSYKTAVSIAPKDRLANRALAAFFMGTGRAPEAELYLKMVAGTDGGPAQVALADYYILLRRLADARRVLEPLAANEQESSRTPAELRLAQITYAENHPADARVMLDKILARDPKNPPALLVKTRWLSNEGKTQEALQAANAAVTADPQSPVAHYLLGMLQMATRDLDSATKSFTEVLRLNPRAADAQLQLSRLNLARGDASTAVQLAQEANKNAPGNPVARLSLARGLLAQRELARAETEIASLLKDYPNAAPVHALSGGIKASRKDVAGARREYERAFELDATSMEALNGLVVLDIFEKNVPRARARVDARLAVQPDRSDLLALAARVYAADQDPTKAERTLRHLIEVDPSGSTGYSMLGQLYLMQRKLDDARAEFEQRVRVNPKDVAAHTMVGMILEAQNNVTGAKKKYDEVLAINPRSLVAANNLAYLYAESGENLDRALSLAQSAVEQAPENPSIQDTLGWVYYKKALPELAARSFEQSIAKDPANPVFHYHLGLAYVRRGDLNRAKQSFESALKLKSDFTDAQRALKSITG